MEEPKLITIDYEDFKKIVAEKAELESENEKLSIEFVKQQARADRFMLAVLDAHYSDWMLDEKHLKGRTKITNVCFGLNNVKELFEMGITYEQMIDYIERKDDEKLGEENEPKEPRF